MDRKSFFQKHINIIRKNKLRCAECGTRLIGDYSEVAHILEKGKFKSIEFDDNNIIYLCAWKNGNNCHGKFDNSSNETFSQMKVFPFCREKVSELLNNVTELYNYKILDRWRL